MSKSLYGKIATIILDHATVSSVVRTAYSLIGYWKNENLKSDIRIQKAIDEAHLGPTTRLTKEEVEQFDTRNVFDGIVRNRAYSHN